jgi:polyferredoxin
MGVTAKEKGLCPRCHGFMVSVILDGTETSLQNGRESPARRCINCGECIDPLILANRLAGRQDVIMVRSRRCAMVAE